MNKKQILIVDDESDFIEIMSAIVASWGYEVSTAKDGKEALEILKAKKPDIIVLDYLMPGMDGVEVLKHIRGKDKDVPVIMFTAHPDMKVINGTEKLGVSAFIPKLSTYSDVPASLKFTIDMILKKAHNKE